VPVLGRSSLAPEVTLSMARMCSCRRDLLCARTAALPLRKGSQEAVTCFCPRVGTMNTIAADVGRPKTNRNPPPYVGGYGRDHGKIDEPSSRCVPIHRSVYFTLLDQALIGGAGVFVDLLGVVHLVGFDEALFLGPALIDTLQAPFGAAFRSTDWFVVN
jgi:hypothetical protein